MLSCFPFSYQSLQEDDYSGDVTIVTIEDKEDKCDKTVLNDSTINLIATESTIGSKNSRLRFSFGRSKGTEHLQQALRKSNHNSSSRIESQRYIKLPTNSCRLVKRNNDVIKSDEKVFTKDNNESDSENVLIGKFERSERFLRSDRSERSDLDIKDRTRDNCKEDNRRKKVLLPPPRPTTNHPGLNMKQSKWFASDLSDFSGGTSNSDNTREMGSTFEVNTNSNFINKPLRGWLHSDQKLTETGISYAVRYVGCLEINTSMKSLEFETRSKIAKECINRVCELGGLKTVDKKRRQDKNICKMLSDKPNMDNAGSNVNLIITSSYLNLTVMETGEAIAKHEMPNISFASGGDADTLDFVAYVAKDGRLGRACFVLECGGGSAQDVITTIGQAFELRYQEFISRKSSRLDPLNSSLCNSNQVVGAIGGEHRDYYNDLPGKVPPDFPDKDNDPRRVRELFNRMQPQATPRTYMKKCNNNNNRTQDLGANLIDLTSDIQNPNELTRGFACSSTSTSTFKEHEYVNFNTDDKYCLGSNGIATLPPLPPPSSSSSSSSSSSVRDPFDMQPFNSTLENVAKMDGAYGAWNLHEEEWFHGSISRKQSEVLVANDGDFLVRESQGSPGQYVLTGMQGGVRKHLLLVDPEGVVRTKDKTFESVSHLISYHQNNGLPIISAESALVLRNPVKR